MTEKIFYQDSFIKEFEGNVLSCEPGKNKNTWDIILDRTAFYPEGGGQPCDLGTIDGVSVLEVHEKKIKPVDVRPGDVLSNDKPGLHELSDAEEKTVIVHTCNAPLEIGKNVHGIIDWDRRFDHMQQHSGEHIVSGMLCSKFNCDNVGFHMGADEVTIDYNTEISWVDINEVEIQANTYIWENHPFIEQWPTKEELKDIDYRSKKELTGDVRITTFPGADCCACCGTHVKESGQVGLVKFLKVENFRGGVRIQVLFGKRAFDYLAGNTDQNQCIATEMSTHGSKTYANYLKLKNELQETKTKLSETEDELFKLIAEGHRGEENVCLIRKGLSGDSLRRLADAIGEVVTGTCAVFSQAENKQSTDNNAPGSGEDSAHRFNYVLVNKTEDIQELVKKMNQTLSGRGGGKKGFAQGSVATSGEKIEEFFLQTGFKNYKKCV